MKPTKARNQRIFRAAKTITSKQISSPLSYDLRKKFGKRNMRVVVDDSVKILRGEYKGIEGKVTKVSAEKNGVAVEGIKKEKPKGDKIDVFINASDILITGLNTNDHWRKSKLEGVEPKTTPKETKQDNSQDKQEQALNEKEETLNEKEKPLKEATQKTEKSANESKKTKHSKTTKETK